MKLKNYMPLLQSFSLQKAYQIHLEMKGTKKASQENDILRRGHSLKEVQGLYITAQRS